ncbi:MAG TPA: hypothetical protein PLD79_04345 [Halothiobacillus sp.]|nr:hypothetical protein [Halothiobacillus sp.]
MAPVIATGRFTPQLTGRFAACGGHDHRGAQSDVVGIHARDRDGPLPQFSYL